MSFRLTWAAILAIIVAGIGIPSASFAQWQGSKTGIVDQNGVQILGSGSPGHIVCDVGCGGSGGTASNFGAAFPAQGTAIGAKNGLNMVNLLADTSGNLQVNCQVGCTGSSFADESAFGFGTSNVTIGGGFFQTTPTNNALTSGQAGAFQATANRAMFVNLRDSSANEIGTATTPINTTTPDATAVTGSITTTQSVTLNNPGGMTTFAYDIAGTWTGTIVVEIENVSGNWYATTFVPYATGLPVASVTANSAGQGSFAGAIAMRLRGNTVATGTANITLRASASGAVFMQDNPNWSVNQTQINGVATAVNTGTTNTGTQRVAVGRDATTIAGAAPGTAGTPSANVVSIQGVASGTVVPITATAFPLPTGASTSANQTDGSQKTQIVDGAGNVIASTSNNLNVQCANCSGTGASAADAAAFTAGVSVFAPSGGFFQTTATSNPLTTGQQGLVQMTANRAFFVNLRTSAGAETGVAAAPLQVSLANTAANGTAVAVSASSLPLPTGAATAANQVTTPATGNGTTNANTQRVTLSSDSTGTVVATQATGANLHMTCDSGCSPTLPPADESTFTFGSSSQSPVGGVYQTTPTSNPLTTGQAGAFQVTAQRALFTNLRTSAGVETGISTTPLQVSIANTGANGTAVLTTGTGGTFPATQSGNWTARVVGNGGATLDAAIGGGTAPTNALAVAGEFLSVLPTLSNGQTAGLMLDSSGRLILSPTNLSIAQASTTSGQTMSLVGGAVTTGNPTYTTAQSDPFSLGTDGGLRVEGTGAAGTASTAVSTVQGITGMTPIVISPSATPDPCTGNAKSTASFSSTTSGGSIVTAASAKKIYVCQVSVVTSTAASVSFIEGTGASVCTGGTPSGDWLNTGTTAANGAAFAANGGISAGAGNGTVFQTANVNQNLCVAFTTTNTPTVVASVSYVQQ